MALELLVLNYNGRALLAACLPSVVAAARRSSRPCQVAVVDNGSTDESLDWLRETYPQVRIESCPNRGLCSYNKVVGRSSADVAVLLNNDVRLAEDALDPLVAPLVDDNPAFEPNCFLTAPRCYRADGCTHEGEKTAVRWRWGLIQGTAYFSGHEQVADRADWTAAAGCAFAVRRDRFLALGGFDPLYLPGRLEDLDLGYRGFAAGWHARYVPEAVGCHEGAGSFGPAFGAAGCDALAWRNTLLFQWKHLRHPWHRLRGACGVAARVARDAISAPVAGPAARFAFTRALRDAWRLRPEAHTSAYRTPTSLETERRFFARFHPRQLASSTERSAA